MQHFDFGADYTLQIDCKSTLKSICDRLDSDSRQDTVQLERSSAKQSRQSSHAKRLKILHDLALKRDDGTIHADLLFAALRTSLPKETIFVADAVTNQVGQVSQNNTSEIDDPLVCCVTGDGAYMFSNPAVAFLDATGHQTPFLTIVINNGGWNAIRMCVDDVHPHDTAASNQNGLYKNHLKIVRPDYVGIAKAASGNTMWGLRVDREQELCSALQEAVNIVKREEVGAILDIVIS